jgi:hypothetical protein
MTNTRTKRPRRGFNVLKRETLAVFEKHGGWLNPSAWAILAKFHPVRAAYSYLGKLHRWGLLDRRHDARGLIFYRLSARGRARFLWLVESSLSEQNPAQS